MSKRNIAYVKPQDPAFLARLKSQIGYKESATVETKRQKLESDWNSDEDFEDRDGEKPTVVVLKEGDLTAEEAQKEEERIAQEAAEAPADLNQRIIFKKRNKDSTSIAETLNTASSTSSTSSSSAANISSTTKQKTSKTTTEKATKKQKSNKSKLSFDDEDEEAPEAEEY